MRFFHRRRRFDDDLDAELRAHVELRRDDLVRQGVPPDEAGRRARVELGAAETYKAACRQTRRWTAVGSQPELIWRDVRHAARRLRAAPLFTLFAAASLALGLSLTTSAHALIHEIIWKPTGVADPDAVFVVMGTGRIARPTWRSLVSEPDFDDLSAVSALAGRVGAVVFFEDRVDIGENVDLDVVRGEAVTGSYFAVVGARPAYGRLLADADDRHDSAAVAVLGDRFWRRGFGSDPAVIGREIRVGGYPVTIVGVAAAGFNGLGVPESTDLWMSRRVIARHETWTSHRARRDDRAVGAMTVLLRLPDVAARASVQATIAAIATTLDADAPRRMPPGWPGAGTLLAPRDWRLVPLPEAEADRGDTMRVTGQAAIGLVALVLVVACTNLGNLLLARGTTRANEVAVRRALGASRARLVRELAAESAIIAVIGAGIAFLVTPALVHAMAMDLPSGGGRIARIEPSLQWPVVVAAVVALGLSLIVFGLGPALRLTRAGTTPFSSQAIGTSGVPSRRLWRSTRLQVAIATLLFLVAAMAVREVLNAAAHDSGIDVDRIAVAVVTFDRQRGQDDVFARRVVGETLQRIRQTPGIEAAAASMGVPFGLTITPQASIGLTGADLSDPARSRWAHAIPTTAGFFETFGVEMLAGRPLLEQDDRPEATPVVVLSAAQARRLFGTSDGSVVGRAIDVRFSGLPGRPPTLSLRIVGIAADTDVGRAMRREGGLIYVPMAHVFSPGLVFSARSSNPDAAVAAIRTAIRQSDRDLALWTAGTAPMILAGGYVLLRVLGLVVLGLAASALLLSMVGLYGVLSQVTSRQTREMGIRIALGATARGLRRAVLLQGLRPVVVGLALGIVLGLIARALFVLGTQPAIDVVDWAALIIVPVPIVLAALLACYLPARRASRVDPNVALRNL